jgi:hypothetical protein
VLGELDQVTFQILCQIVVEAVLLQELEGVVPRADGLELKAAQIFVVIVQQRIEDLSVIEELLEDPELAKLEKCEYACAWGLHRRYSTSYHNIFDHRLREEIITDNNLS